MTKTTEKTAGVTAGYLTVRNDLGIYCVRDDSRAMVLAFLPEKDALQVANTWNAYKNLEAATGVPAAKLASNQRWLVEMVEALKDGMREPHPDGSETQHSLADMLRDLSRDIIHSENAYLLECWCDLLKFTADQLDKVLAPLSQADAGRGEG